MQGYKIFIYFNENLILRTVVVKLQHCLISFGLSVLETPPRTSSHFRLMNNQRLDTYSVQDLNTSSFKTTKKHSKYAYVVDHNKNIDAQFYVNCDKLILG